MIYETFVLPRPRRPLQSSVTKREGAHPVASIAKGACFDFLHVWLLALNAVDFRLQISD